ncbi:Inosine uridine-preferring nucleoside hydrolase [Neofusicoccum parvum]|nr:Inosine uridine-preferring nucleoside hydrolase [Neofusicoccum parvum]
MKLLAALLTALPIAAAAPATFRRQDNTTSTPYRPKVILDNDWSPAGFIPFLQALDAGWEVLGLASDTANTWALQTGLHGLATLEVGNLSCIPVYKGADYPLLHTVKRYEAWKAIHGALPWEGAFAPENLTYEALGNDPTSGDPRRVSRAAFSEGFPNTTFAADTNAAYFMVQQVRKYPGEVSIYAGGALTNIALAVRMDPDFASLAKELIIMGGYLDVNLLQTTGSVMQADINGDINLMIDPEAAKIALTADFPNISKWSRQERAGALRSVATYSRSSAAITSTVTNQVFPTQDFLDEVYAVKNPYSELFYNQYGTVFPFWDETTAAIMIDPSIVTNSTQFYLDVDTAYASSRYGNIHAYQEALAPPGLRLVNFPIAIDGDRLKAEIKRAVQHPKSCADIV